MTWNGKLLAVALAAVPACVVAAGPTLSLTTTQSAPLAAGDEFEVTLSMSDLGAWEAAGFDAFIGFDEGEVQFVSGAYTAAPFGLHIIVPITAVGGEIDLAAGINPVIGQLPTSADADLVTLTFESVSGGCATSIGFRAHDPPTRLTTDTGQSIEPLTLVDLGSAPIPSLVLSVAYGTYPVLPGDFVVVTLSMGELCVDVTAGFQAFLEFDPLDVSFVSGTYTGTPFGQPIIWPVAASGNEIDLAAGIDIPGGQTPTSAAADLAILTFSSVSGGCVTSVAFRDNAPPTRLTDPVGDEITPLALTSLPEDPCPADIVPDCEVNVDDLLLLLASWGMSGVPADIDEDGVVDVNDLLLLLAAWGPCVP